MENTFQITLELMLVQKCLTAMFINNIIYCILWLNRELILKTECFIYKLG